LVVCEKELVIRSESGDPEMCVIDCGAGGGFSFCDVDKEEGVNAIFTGLTIRNATIGVKVVTTGLMFEGVCLELNSCIVEGCAAEGIKQSAMDVYLTMSNCRIRYNGAGGVASSSMWGQFTLDDCYVHDNGGTGVSMSNSEGYGGIVRHSVFAGNGGHGLKTDYVCAEDCTFEDNALSGAYVWSSGGSFADCDFARNRDGGVHFEYAEGWISATRCRFLDNSAAIAGGGIGILGSSYNGYKSFLTLADCLFSGNTSPKGGAVYCGDGDSYYLTPMLDGTIRGCTFYGNAADVGSFAYIQTDAESWTPSSVHIENTIIAAHSSGEPLYCEEVDTLEVTCSDVFGNDGGDWVGCLAGLDTIPGNVSADPLFCDPATGDFHLAATSLCIQSECGLIGALGEGCFPSATLDIQPGSCPNILDIDASGDDMLSVAILGARWLDVLQVVPESVRLEGFAPPWWSYEDVAGPAAGGDTTACPAAEPDGYRDMILEFKAAEIAAAIGNASPGDVVTLRLTGTLAGGADFSAADRVTIAHSNSLIHVRGSHVILGPVIPNPANPTARIAYYLPRETHVDLVIYDVAGRVVARVLHEAMPAGEHEVVWNAAGVASGVYFAQLVTAREEATYKLVVMK